MRTNLFTSSVTFKLCGLDVDGHLADTEDIRIQNITIEGMTYLNSYIRQHYLTAQKDAVKDWPPKERDAFLKLAMSHIVRLSIDTKDGRDILFNTLDGMLHYTWVFVKHRFPTLEEWDAVLRSNMLVYSEIMSRFNTAMFDLALLTSKEFSDDEIPDEQNTEGIDQMLAALTSIGIPQKDARKLTLEQADAILRMHPNFAQQENGNGQTVAMTNNPEEFKEILKQTLERRNNGN